MNIVKITAEECWTRFQITARQIFSNWMLLRLAVENGWGGRNSATKSDELFNNVIEKFRVSATQKNRPVLVDELTYYLNDQLLELFNVEADDDSDEEVAQLLVDVFTACGKQDFTIADQILTHAVANSNSCQKQSPASDQSDAESSSDEEASIQESDTAVNDQMTDVDGWQTVGKKNNKR